MGREALVPSHMTDLDLLSTPTLVGLAHVGRRLDGGDEFKDNVSDTGESNNAAGDIAKDVAMDQDGADENVD